MFYYCYYTEYKYKNKIVSIHYENKKNESIIIYYNHAHLIMNANTNNANTNNSFFIPYVKPHDANEVLLKEQFEITFRIGQVDHMDVKKAPYPDKHGNEFCMVYIHFQKLYQNGDIIMKRIREEGNYKLYFQKEKFWTLLENKGKKHTLGDRKLCIDLGPNHAVSHTDAVMDQTDWKNMAEIEALMDKDDEEDNKHLITIDGRYVQHLEEEINRLKTEIKCNSDMMNFARY